MPEKVGEEAEQLICAVPAVTVKLAALVSVVPKFIGVLADKATVPDPKSKVLECALLLEIELAVKLYVSKSNSPLIMVIVEFPISMALPSAHSELTPFTSIEDASTTPFVVNVNPDVDPDSVIAPVYVRVSPVAGSVTLP